MTWPAAELDSETAHTRTHPMENMGNMPRDAVMIHSTTVSCSEKLERAQWLKTVKGGLNPGIWYWVGWHSNAHGRKDAEMEEMAGGGHAGVQVRTALSSLGTLQSVLGSRKGKIN